MKEARLIYSELKISLSYRRPHIKTKDSSTSCECPWNTDRLKRTKKMRNTETLRQEGDVGVGEGLQLGQEHKTTTHPSKAPEP